MTFRIIAGAVLTLALSTTAFAQSYNAPAGIPSATAPGGLTGSAAPGNVYRYGERYDRFGSTNVEDIDTTGSVRGYRSIR